MVSSRIRRKEKRRNRINQVRRIPIFLALLAILLAIVDFGFNLTDSIRNMFWIFYLSVLVVEVISIVTRYFFVKVRPTFKVWPFDIVLLASLIIVLLNQFGFANYSLFKSHLWVYLLAVFTFIREFSLLKAGLIKRLLNPAQVFILSFVGVILWGTLLLMLPNATVGGLSFIDALFTSTSAVCVTGLVVVDTGSYFTGLGQLVIITLIQIGGLGIMTFASYFSYFFKGKSTYETQLMIKDMTNADKMAEVFGTLKKVLLLTMIVELVGAVAVYFTISPAVIPDAMQRIYFSIFHSISGFCNAGFSTLPNNLADSIWQFNYPLQLVLAFLFIIGGIGFPIVFNLTQYLKYLVKYRLILNNKRQAVHFPWVINMNTRIVFITTTILIVGGSILFYMFEFNNTLKVHSGFGKIVTAFFSACTPRTAGFNSVDTSALGFGTIMMLFLLMWIGASPGSTGGGIKTSTFAIGTLNFLSLAKGKDRLELFRREIADISVKRAFAVIALSLVIIGASVFFIALIEGYQDLLPIAFECFSAYSTVGLSLGITASLSSASKLVIIFTMFIGRVGMLTILIALFRRTRDLKYRYPKEEILIN